MSHGLMKGANFRIERRGCFSQVKDMCKLDKFPSRQITRSISVVDPSILEPNIKTKPQARFLYSGKEVKIKEMLLKARQGEAYTTPTIGYNPESKNVQDPTELLKHSLWMLWISHCCLLKERFPVGRWSLEKLQQKIEVQKKQAHSGETLGSSTAASNLDLPLQIAGVVIKRGDHSFQLCNFLVYFINLLKVMSKIVVLLLQSFHKHSKPSSKVSLVVIFTCYSQIQILQ